MVKSEMYWSQQYIWLNIPEFTLQISGGTFQCQQTSTECMKLPYIALFAFRLQSWP